MGDFLKSIIKKALIIFLCGGLFFGASYGYLHFNFNKQAAKAEQKEYAVPYKRIPENVGIAFVFPDASAILAYLEFDESRINLLDIEQFQPQPEYFGYTADYVVECDYTLVEGLVDRVGGVSLSIDGGIMRYTGSQVLELIATGKGKQIKKQLISQFFARIEKNNFSKDDFIYIIENSKSDLSFVDCIYWIEYIDDMSKNINFVN